MNDNNLTKKNLSIYRYTIAILISIHI